MTKKKKIYIVELEIIDSYDEDEVEANSIKEARKIAEERNPEYKITDIYLEE